MTEPGLLELLYAALHSPLGIVVETNDPVACKARLYALRQTDPELARLSFLVSPTNPTGSFWIIKKDSPDAETSPDKSNFEPP